MTFPDDLADITSGWQPGQRQFRSWIMLLVILPLEYYDLTFVEVEPGRRFLERSTMLTQQVWQHERIIEPEDGGCRITDRVAFEARLPGLGLLLMPIFRAVFSWRHRQLRKLFGEIAH